MERSILFRTAAVFVVLAAGVYLAAVMLRLAGFMFDLLIVVFLAWIISSNGRRLSIWLQRVTHVPFGVSVALAYVIILVPVIVMLALFVPLAVGQVANLARVVQDLSAEAPAVFESVQTIAERFGVEADLRGLYETRLLAQAGTAIGNWLSTNAFNIARTTAGTMFQLFLVFSLSVYMVLEANRLGAVFLRIMPRGWHDEIEFVYGTMDRVFSQWLRGVVIIGSIFATMTFV
ncbi:MAG: AI-2E family transporter, partial [Chloroflexi bacterium]|nr:AI-2E family transporter [Chloroflexota bacterium]